MKSRFQSRLTKIYVAITSLNCSDRKIITYFFHFENHPHHYYFEWKRLRKSSFLHWSERTNVYLKAIGKIQRVSGFSTIGNWCLIYISLFSLLQLCEVEKKSAVNKFLKTHSWLEREKKWRETWDVDCECYNKCCAMQSHRKIFKNVIFPRPHSALQQTPCCN